MAADFKRPDEWEDEERMNFLMSPFPPNSRPSLSDPKVTFWRDLITSSSRELSQWTFTKREITHRLSWHKMESKCLPVVIDTLVKAGVLRKLSSYNIEGEGWVGWGLKILSSPMTWAWQRYGYSQQEETNNETVYVLVPVVKELCENIIGAHFQNVTQITTDCIMSHYDFEQLIQRIAKPANKRSLLVLELNLFEEQKVTKGSSEDNDEVVVKFANSQREKASQVTDMDIGLLSMLKTIEDLRNKLKRKSEDIQSLKKRSLECKRKGNKNEAITYFKKMKTIEKTTLNIDQQLTNLTSILDQIQSAETNAKVLKAYESGVAALKGIQEKEGLTIERAENVMDDLQELLEEGDGVGKALATGGQLDPYEIDETDLLKELEELENIDEIENKVRSVSLEDDIPSLPSPPQTTPISSLTSTETQDKEKDSHCRHKIKSNPLLIS